MARWSAVLTDRNFVPQGELFHFGNFRFNRSLSKLATWGFNVRLDNEHVNRLADADGYIKMYRNNVLMGFGPILTAEQSVAQTEQTLAVNCADAGWILGKRLAGKSGTGQQFTTATDLAQIAKTLIDATNAENETGISTTAYTLSAGSARTYTAGPYRNILEIMSELGSALDGFDWIIRPSENWNNGALTGAKIGALQAQPLIGVSRPNAVFEYGPGTRSNVLSFVKTRTRDGQANRVFHIPSDPANAVYREDASKIAAWDLLEDVAQAEITDTAMVNNLLDEHVRVRGNPRDIVKMTPHIDPGVTGRLPLPFEDYDVGDTITARIAYNGQVRFAGLLRVYGISISVDQETGFERVELTLEEES